MQKLIATAKDFINDEDGATAVEYGLMVSLIAGVIVITVTALGNKLVAVFTAITAAMP